MKSMIRVLGVGVVLAALLSGCGESAELKLRNADLALKNGKPDQALQLANEVLTKTPENAEATEIKAQAQIQLLQLDEALKTIDQLAQAHPELAKARRMKAEWAMSRLSTLLKQSDFST